MSFDEFLENLTACKIALRLDNSAEQWELIRQMQDLGYKESGGEPGKLMEQTFAAMNDEHPWNYLVDGYHGITFAREGFVVSCNMRTVNAEEILNAGVGIAEELEDLIQSETGGEHVF